MISSDNWWLDKTNWQESDDRVSSGFSYILAFDIKVDGWSRYASQSILESVVVADASCTDATILIGNVVNRLMDRLIKTKALGRLA